MPTYPVEQYAIDMPSSNPTTDFSVNGWVARIYLFEVDGTNTILRGLIYFHPDGTPLLPAEFTGSYIKLRFNLCQFDAAIEILRTERPLYAYFFNPGNAGLKSGREPTGEEET